MKTLPAFLLVSLLTATSSALAEENCLKVDIVDQPYPIARDTLISEGWVPNYLSPPFEGAKFADWVKVRNFAEVEVCAPTGRANCTFKFHSGDDSGQTLSVYTHGEELGVVTGYECTKRSDAAAIAADENNEHQIDISKRWVRQAAPDFYVAKTFDYEKSFDFRIHCMANNKDKKPNSIYLSVGQDTIASDGHFEFEDGKSYTFAFDDNGYALINSPVLAEKFDKLVHSLKAGNQVIVKTEHSPSYSVSLRGSSKSIGTCPTKNVSNSNIQNTSKADAAEPHVEQVPNDAQVAVQKTLPTGEADIIDYRIETCTGTKGFGYLQYSNSNANRTVLTDFCLDEESGDFWSAENLSGLELTASSAQGRKFEDLSSGSSFYERNHVHVLPDENIPGCTPESLESLHATFQSPKNKGFRNSQFGHLIGYIPSATAPKPKLNKAEIYFGLRLVSPDPSQKATFKPYQLVNPQGDMLADALFDGNGGTISIKSGAGHTYGDANGSLEIEFEGDGTFTLSGSYAAKSLRLKGHEQNEMLSHEGELAHFRGHILGSDGSGLVGYGIAEGEVTLASGKVHKYQSMAYLMACVK